MSRVAREVLTDSIITRSNANSLSNNILNIDNLSKPILKSLSYSQQGTHTFTLASFGSTSITEIVNSIMRLTKLKSIIQNSVSSEPTQRIDNS